jgi:hypothetical protein
VLKWFTMSLVQEMGPRLKDKGRPGSGYMCTSKMLGGSPWKENFWGGPSSCEGNNRTVGI